ncbi:MAG: PEP-CTERM system histidine kinase PrsK, partial [Pseudomonadota bacterium]|nr:PEP-CTERM system histidine kinase PrsK [Pseudomonadota bacterium]
AAANVFWRLRPVFFGFALMVLAVDLLPYLPIAVNVIVEIRILGHVFLAVCGLALIEQLFRNTRPDQRWATKFLYLGLGTLFAYDFYLYADALLFKRIDEQVWYARGLVNTMVVPLIAVSAARNPQWSLAVFVSRRIVIHTASIFGAGLYLLIMAGAGYYIRTYGGTWGPAVQVAFLSGAGLLLIILLFSGQLRATLKVFLTKHFFSYKFDYREEWLKLISTLSNAQLGNSLRERVILAVAEILDSPGGMLWTRADNGGFYLAASVNMGEQEQRTLAADSSMVRFLESREWVLDLDEYESEPEVYAGLDLPDWLWKIRRAWIVVPLMHVDNQLQGFIVLARSRAERQINWEDRDLLKTAGRQMASYIALVNATEALLDARQFEAFNRLSAYVVHDLKNVAAQLSLVVSNAARHKHNPAFIDDAIRTVENATARMNRMLDQLRKGASSSAEIRVFSLAEAIQDVVRRRQERQPPPVLVEADSRLRLRANRDRFTAVLEHLVQNAQEATPADGKVLIRAYQAADHKTVIEIADTGCGMDEQFLRERLFRPFTTTKGNAGMGIGVYESREFVQALGGEIDVVSKAGVGTTFFLHLPAVEAQAVADRLH